MATIHTQQINGAYTVTITAPSAITGYTTNIRNLNVEWMSEEDEVMPGVVPAVCRCAIDYHDDLLAQYNDLKITIVENSSSTVKYLGRAMPWTSQRTIEGDCSILNIEFNCGLGFLDEPDNVDAYVQASFDGTVAGTLPEILCYLLAPGITMGIDELWVATVSQPNITTPLNLIHKLKLGVADMVYKLSTTVDNQYYAITTSGPENFATAKQLLDDILKSLNCVLYQQNERYVLRELHQGTVATVHRYDLTANGAYITIASDPMSTIALPTRMYGGSQTYLPPIKQVFTSFDEVQSGDLLSERSPKAVDIFNTWQDLGEFDSRVVPFLKLEVTSGIGYWIFGSFADVWTNTSEYRVRQGLEVRIKNASGTILQTTTYGARVTEDALEFLDGAAYNAGGGGLTTIAKQIKFEYEGIQLDMSAIHPTTYSDIVTVEVKAQDVITEGYGYYPWATDPDALRRYLYSDKVGAGSIVDNAVGGKIVIYAGEPFEGYVNPRTQFALLNVGVEGITEYVNFPIKDSNTSTKGWWSTEGHFDGWGGTSFKNYQYFIGNRMLYRQGLRALREIELIKDDQWFGDRFTQDGITWMPSRLAIDFNSCTTQITMQEWEKGTGAITFEQPTEGMFGWENDTSIDWDGWIIPGYWAANGIDFEGVNQFTPTTSCVNRQTNYINNCPLAEHFIVKFQACEWPVDTPTQTVFNFASTAGYNTTVDDVFEIVLTEKAAGLMDITAKRNGTTVGYWSDMDAALEYTMGSYMKLGKSWTWLASEVTGQSLDHTATSEAFNFFAIMAYWSSGPVAPNPRLTPTADFYGHVNLALAFTDADEMLQYYQQKVATPSDSWNGSF